MKHSCSAIHVFDFGRINPETALSEIVVTYKQGNTIVLEKHKEDFEFSSYEKDGKTYYEGTIVLDQTETKSFNPSVVAKVQTKWLDENGFSGASDIFNVDVEEMLHPQVLGEDEQEDNGDEE